MVVSLLSGSANCYIWSATFGPFWLSVGDQATRNSGSYITTAVCLCTLSEAEVPVPVHQILCTFQSLFEEPTSLPPSMFCDHTIPLIAGVRPVNIRPYWFSPVMKDEVETQVSDMLRSGLIRPSSSAFYSPVILVKKKDQTWRFYVDYRHLNALTVKAK
jgi:hypothetical protein